MLTKKASGKFLLAGCIATALLLQGCSPTSQVPSEIQDSQAIPSGPFTPQVSSAFDDPWPTDVTRREIIETSLYKGFEFLDSISKQECGIQVSLFMEESLPLEHRQLVQTISNEMKLIFCDYLTDDIWVLAGRSDFVKEVVREEGLPSDEFGGVCGYFIPKNDESKHGCAFKGRVAWVGTTLGSDQGGVVTTDEFAVATVAHELFHIAHAAMDPDPDGQIPPPGQSFYRPVWFVEGGGEYFGNLIPMYLDIQSYPSWVPLSVNNEPLTVNELSELSGLELRLDGDQNYYSGQIALEYITASVGMEALLDVWVRMGKGASFEQAFSQAIGITVAEFYVKFSMMHRNLYEGEIVE